MDLPDRRAPAVLRRRKRFALATEKARSARELGHQHVPGSFTTCGNVTSRSPALPAERTVLTPPRELKLIPAGGRRVPRDAQWTVLEGISEPFGLRAGDRALALVARRPARSHPVRADAVAGDSEHLRPGLRVPRADRALGRLVRVDYGDLDSAERRRRTEAADVTLHILAVPGVTVMAPPEELKLLTMPDPGFQRR